MLKTLATLSIVLFGLSSVSAQNLLLDPSFDLSTPNSQTNPNWTLEVDLPDGVGPSAQFQDAPWASNPNGTPGIGVWLKAFEGNQAGGGDPLANATLYQDVTSAAGDYNLSFFFKKETNFQSENTFVELLENGSRIGLVDLTDVPATGTFEEFSLSGSTAGGSLRVQAKMVNGFDSMTNPQSAMFDDFSLTVVPEPSSMIGMSLGVAFVVLGRRRRTRA